jgi:hypothetical protein
VPKKSRLQHIYDHLLNIVSSRRFFYVAVGVLVVQSAWIALTARYPQAYDENFHFGLIQLHAQQLLPFFTSQPPNSAVYGAVVRDPSYLYHYLLSLPYWLMLHLGASQTVQIIILRFINIGFIAAGVFVYRKLFEELHISTAITNVVLLFFGLLPTIPLMAGQLNYDNLMFWLAALLLLYTLRYVRWLQTSPGDMRSIPVLLILQIIVIGAAGSIVTFPFAPIFLASVVILAVMTWWKYRSIQRMSDHSITLSSQLTKALPERKFDLPSRVRFIVFAVLAVLMLGLCVERYGINLIRYHNPVPDCGKVLSVEQCQAYSPWARNYLYAATYPHPSVQKVVSYPIVWFHRMVYETMFTITSYFNTSGTVNYNAFPPLTIANYTAWTITIVGGVLGIIYSRRIVRDPALRVLLLIAGFYIFVLFIQNFTDYLQVGEVVAVHGRYLAAVFPLLLYVLVAGFRQLLTSLRLQRFKLGLLALVLLLFLQGGGITDWIISSTPAWYWQQSRPAARANWLAQDVLDKIVRHP